MSFAGWRFLVFALIGAAGIVLLASIGVPGKQPAVTLDRHTGEQKVVVRTAADALFEGRAAGDARRALELLQKRKPRFPKYVPLHEIEATLLAELGARDEPPREDHPAAARILAEQSRATRAREELHARVRELPTPEALLALLKDLEADESNAAATEAYFAPLGRWRTGGESEASRPDEWAARTIERFEEIAAGDDPAPLLEVAQAFRAHGRRRARMRWLLRAYGAFARSPQARTALLDGYVEYGAIQEAFLVAGAILNGTPDDYETWRLRAKMAGWLSLPGAEAEARERLLAEQDSAAARRRLITLYDAIGEPEKAIPHARALARVSDDAEERALPARLALDAGRVDEAIAILEEEAARAADPLPWRERILAVAWQDLRVERVVRELDALRREHPGGGYEERLEGVYRRRNMSIELADLLAERLAREHDPELEREVLGLYATSGREDRVRELLVARLERDPDPRRFFGSLAAFRALELPGLEQRAGAMAASPRLRAEDVEPVLADLRPYLDEEAFADAATVVARRHARIPAAREFLLEMVDRRPVADARAAAAEELFHAHPDDAALLQAWIDRASWAAAVESEVRARELLLEREPEDDVNRRKLADLYGALPNRAADAAGIWRYFVEKEGLESEATLHLVDALFAVGEVDEAIVWLEKRAALPGTTNVDRLHVAEQLFGNQHFDRALRFYTAVLEADAAEPTALLRTGQIRAWTNDPRGAIPFFERRLAVTDEGAAEVRFYLGEAYWAGRESARARELHERALGELRAIEPRSTDQRVMVAKILSRLGRIDEAAPLFDELIAEMPRNDGLLLDYADSMIAVRRFDRARELVDRAKEISPGGRRTLRLDGSLAVREERYGPAAQVLAETLERFGPDAAVEAELGLANERRGAWREARDAYARSLVLQPQNFEVRTSSARMSDLLAGVLQGEIVYQDTGPDSFLGLRGVASKLLDDDRRRAAVAVGFARYSGRAAAVAGGTRDVTESVVHVDASYFRRLAGEWEAAGGLELFLGAPGDLPAGGWAGVLWQQPEPFRHAGLRLHGNLLLDDPAAAVALSGRRSGAELFGYHELPLRFWVSGAARLEWLELATRTARETDGRVGVDATFGWRLLGGDARVADPITVDRNRLPGLLGPDVVVDSGETNGPHLSAWIGYQSVRLRDDRTLATLVPLGTQLDYVSVAARGDVHLRAAWGAKAEIYFGRELRAGETFGGGDVGLTWRRDAGNELTLAAGYGRAFGRADATDAFWLRFRFTRRW